MTISEWMILCAPFFTITIVCGYVLRRRGRGVSQEMFTDICLALGGILLIGLDKHVFLQCAQNIFTKNVDDVAVGPVFIATLNLFLATLRRPTLRTLPWCLGITFCFGLVLEYVYPLCSRHVGGDWFDISLYVSGGAFTVAVYWFCEFPKSRHRSFFIR